MFEFQVFYVGKIKVSHPKVPESFIDEALIKFRVHGLEKSRSSTSNLLSDCQRLKRQALMSSINRRNSTVIIFSVIIQFCAISHLSVIYIELRHVL